MPSWSWDEQTSGSGVAHQSTANTDHIDATKLKQGYDYANFSEITPDPVACWPFHEDSGSTAYDLSGSNDGTYHGATLGQTAILETTCPSLDGTDDYIEMGSGPDFSTIDTVTVCGWVNGSSDGRIFNSIDGSGTDYKLVVNISGGTIFAAEYTPGSYSSVSGSVTISDGEWHFVAVTADYSTDDVEIYVDGSLDTSGAFDGGYDNPASGVAFGDDIANRDEPLSARLSDWRVYTTVLTSADIEALYNVVAAEGEWVGNGKLL